ncbi:Protein Y43F8C.13 [Aphelenchoides avenae]|nr:Protein Y43F8C.13 [Aphelenchus avenae]
MTRIVIDTDGGCDDARAISLALHTPGVEVPIYKGAAEPLIGTAFVRKNSRHGSDGLGNVPNEEPQLNPDDCNAHVAGYAAEGLLALFRQHKYLTLVCIGPLTNVALALKLGPEFASLPAKLVIMGGNLQGTGSVKPDSTAEFNFFSDPESAHIVLQEMRCRIVIVPYETYLRESINPTVDFHAHLSSDALLARFLEAITRYGRSELSKNGRQFAYCDEIAVAVAIAADRVVKETKDMSGSVELHGEYTRGQLAVDWMYRAPPESTDRRILTFITAYDPTALNAMVYEAIQHSVAT